MKTLKEIRDRQGLRSIWVVEHKFKDMNTWYPLLKGNGFTRRKDAVCAKNSTYDQWKYDANRRNRGRSVRRKDFRVALYVRAE